MRTPEVEAAMKRSVTDTELVETKTPPWNRETLASVDRRTLAAEIERLEAELAKSDEAARAAMYAVDERAFLAECAETSVKRAEAAEARVKELGRDSVNMFDEAKRAQNAEKDALARVAELETQHARLRAALEDVSLLAHCISKAGPLNTPDLETAWRKFDLISVKAAEALVDRKAALNGEEASK